MKIFFFPETAIYLWKCLCGEKITSPLKLHCVRAYALTHDHEPPSREKCTHKIDISFPHPFKCMYGQSLLFGHLFNAISKMTKLIPLAESMDDWGDPEREKVSSKIIFVSSSHSGCPALLVWSEFLGHFPSCDSFFSKLLRMDRLLAFSETDFNLLAGADSGVRSYDEGVVSYKRSPWLAGNCATWFPGCR